MNINKKEGRALKNSPVGYFSDGAKLQGRSGEGEKRGSGRQKKIKDKSKKIKVDLATCIMHHAPCTMHLENN
jgi:hypothetical protein